MEHVNTPVPTLRATLAALVTLAMNWTPMNSTAQVIIYKTMRQCNGFSYIQILMSVLEMRLSVCLILPVSTLRVITRAPVIMALLETVSMAVKVSVVLLR